MEPQSTRELLLALRDDVQRILQAIDGNGQPGLITRVAKLEERTTPSGKTAATAGGVGAVLIVIAQFLLAKIGVTI